MKDSDAKANGIYVSVRKSSDFYITKSDFVVFNFFYCCIFLFYRCTDRWEVVLHCVLGAGETNNKVEFAEEETVGGVPFIFFYVRNRVLQTRDGSAQAP